MSDAKDGPLRLISEANNFPPMRRDDLFHNREPKSHALGSHCDVGIENVCTLRLRHTVTIVTNFQRHFVRSRDHHGSNFDQSTRLDRLNGIEQQIKQRLPEKLLIRLHRQRPGERHEANLIILDVGQQRTGDISDEP
jgi:hypothetical protein